MDTRFIAVYILVIAIAICVFMVVCFNEISSEIDDLKKQINNLSKPCNKEEDSK